MRKILVVLVLLQVFSHAEELNNNKIRELIESSPEANEPQNKNLKNTLKNQKSPVNFKEQILQILQIHKLIKMKLRFL